MKLKGKLIAGIVFFFLLLLLVAGAALYFNSRLHEDAKAIVKDNYESLEYCHRMQQLIHHDSIGSADMQFEMQLKQQQANITEPGESNATHSLGNHFRQWRTAPSDDLKQAILQDLERIIEINMQAINNKNKVAIHTALIASDWIKVLCAFIFLIGFSFVLNFPAIIVSPINRLQEGISEIMNKNFKHRVTINGKDELAQLGKAFNSMAAKLDEYEHSNLNKMMFEKSRAEAVVNSLQDASVGVDTQKRILFANQPALELLGMKSTDLIGRELSAVVGRNDLLRHLVEGTSQAPFKIVVSGREQYFSKESISIVKDEEQLGTLYTLRNITNFQEKDTAKTNFIAMVSHELKTPLAAIRMSVDLLDHEKVGLLNTEQKELIQSIKEDAARLLKITGELLNMSQVETGHMQLQVSAVDVKPLVDYALHASQLAAAQKEILLKRMMPAETLMAQADPERTLWVLNNLLSNAIRYSPAGTSVSVECSNQGGQVLIAVEDEGPGIDPQYHQKIFERYFRIPGSEQGGTGLGLATSKEIMEAMGGSIALQSMTGKGARFVLSLQSAS